MKKLIGISVSLILTLTSFAPVSFASHPPSDAHPSSGKFQGAIHHFDYQVKQNTLTEMRIKLPPNIQIGGVEIEDESGKLLTAKVEINEQEVKLIFDKQVPPQTKISIKLQEVNTPGYGHTWQYDLFGKLEGIEQEVPLGSVQIQTYD